jgi:hypothetical protein
MNNFTSLIGSWNCASMDDIPMSLMIFLAHEAEKTCEQPARHILTSLPEEVDDKKCHYSTAYQNNQYKN